VEKSRKKGCLIVCVLLAALFIRYCVPVSYEITDNYIVYPKGDALIPEDRDFGTKGHYLICNPGCNFSVRIDNVKSIRWDKKHLIVEQREEGKSNWYLIIAKGEELQCCRDTLIGPVSRTEMDSLVHNKNLKLWKMKLKRF